MPSLQPEQKMHKMPSLRMSLGINSPIFFLNKASQKALRLYKKLKCLPTHHASICASGQVQAPGPTPVLVYDPQCGPLFFQYFQSVFSTSKGKTTCNGQAISGTSAPRLYNSYNHCPSRPSHVAQSRPRA